jgi:hypothetical protein
MPPLRIVLPRGLPAAGRRGNMRAPGYRLSQVMHKNERDVLEGSVMTRWLLIAAVAFAAVCANGCIVINTEKAGSCWTTRVEPEDVTIREIDAVGKLDLESNRREGYNRIAQRRCLSAGAQTHLIQAVFENLDLESSKFDVLMTLVHNPCFHSTAKAALLDRLDGLALESHRRELLDAMSKHRD